MSAVWPAAVVFDFDGLLMDTETTSLQSWRYEWAQWGLSLDVASFFVDHGGDITEQRYGELADAVGSGFDRVRSHARRTAYRERLHRELDLAEGLRDWIEEARASRLRLAVASSSPTDWVIGHLRRAAVSDVFEVYACGDEVDAHKPAPDVYELALRRLGVTGDQAVAVEDTPHGVAAAKAAGLRTIAIPNPFADHSRFDAADLVLRSAGHLTLGEALSRLP
ncbi:MAG: HAD-IA family hydrolase [Propionibacteriales bacterium]|nr:HAD-IA family hydrolase [Propionibacteriales bacterium]